MTAKHQMMQNLKQEARNRQCFVFECDSWRDLLKAKDLDVKVAWLHKKCLQSIQTSLEHVNDADKRWLLENWAAWLNEQPLTLETMEEFFEIVKRCHIYPTVFFFENWEEMYEETSNFQSEDHMLPIGMGDPVSALLMRQKTANHEFAAVVKSVSVTNQSLSVFGHKPNNEERFYSVPLDSIDPLLKSDPFPFHSNLTEEEKQNEIEELKRIMREETVAYPWIYKMIAEYYKSRPNLTVKSAWQVVQEQIYLYLKNALPQHARSMEYDTHHHYLQNHSALNSEIFDYFIAKRVNTLGISLQYFLLVESLTYFSDFREHKADVHPICIAVQDAMVDFWLPLERKMWNFQASRRCGDLKQIFYHNSTSPKRRDSIMMELLRRFLCDQNDKGQFPLNLRDLNSHQVAKTHLFNVHRPLRFAQLGEDATPDILNEEYIGKGTLFLSRDAKDINSDFQVIVKNEKETIFFKNAELQAFHNDVKICEEWVNAAGDKATVVLMIPQREYNSFQEERFNPVGVTENVYVAFYEDWIHNLDEVLLFIRDQKKAEKSVNTLFDDSAFSEKELNQLMKLSKKVRLMDNQER
eukprot:CAMPEP_0117438376 /NCGR_PEP_ID=MMETSP0759-20121206/2021_1 /TAXON_ID=63605 /ORGANISM="Percolomonas cosmopolitus, Strain WS" /LENGTH=579 /DNA_ID=CAMNT_0005230065 /DNA_START=217 /DNA_END=1953 /DNA_ORIENTATION=-